MAITTHITTWLLVLILMASASSAVSSSSGATTDLARAIEEMQRANYFTFVVLIDLAPPELIQGNLTFLMPHDKALSESTLRSQSSMADFLLRHSIPSPLLFEHLQRFPTGSILPTSKSGFLLNITNGGRRSFFLNNVRITSPNICTSGSSFRCHGIDGVIQSLQLPATPGSNNTPPPPLPPTPTPTPPDHHTGTRPPPPLPSPGAVAEAPPPAAPSPPVIGFNQDPSTTPPPSNSNHQHNSASRPQLMFKCDFTFLTTLTTCLMLLATKLSM